MKTRIPLVLAALCLGCALGAVAEAQDAANAPAETDGVRRILIMAVEASNVPEAAAHAVEDALARDIGQRSGISVITSAELKQTVSAVESGQELGCDANEQCMVEIRKKLQASEVVAAKLSKYDEGLMLALRLIETNDQTVRRHVTRIVDDLTALQADLPSAVDELLGQGERKARFVLPKDRNQKLAVMPLEALGVTAETADNLTQVLSQELSEMGFEVLGRDDIEAMLQATADGAQLGCTDSLECVIKIAANFSASTLLFGSVGKAAGLYVVSLKLVDVDEAEVQSRALQSFDGDAVELSGALRLASYELVGAEYRDRTSRVDLSFNVREAEAALGPTKKPVTNSRLLAERLQPGCQTLRVQGDPDDYYPFQTDLCLVPDRKHVRNLELEAKPTPWYGQWWFWTTIGVVAAGGTVAAVMLSQAGEPSTGSGTVVLQ